VVEVIAIGGGLHVLLEANFSGNVFSVPVITMSMSVVLRDVIKLQVTTVFGGSFIAIDVWTEVVN
jgi:hypothetical protein